MSFVVKRTNRYTNAEQYLRVAVLRLDGDPVPTFALGTKGNRTVFATKREAFAARRRWFVVWNFTKQENGGKVYRLKKRAKKP